MEIIHYYPSSSAYNNTATAPFFGSKQPLLPLLPKRRTQLLPCPIRQHPTSRWYSPQLKLRLSPVSVNSSCSSAVFSLAAEAPASSGDYSVFFIMASLLFFVYWIANFLVPEMINKNINSNNQENEN